MTVTSDKSAERVRLLIIDDSQPSRLVQTFVIEENFENVEVVSGMQPPPLEEILGFDGVVLDERLIGESGIEIARRIHDKNWRIPLMIMTSLRPEDVVFETAYEVVDYVASKSDPKFGVNVMRAFIRQMRRIKAAAGPGRKKAGTRAK
jgi:DNA-binding response OmpR family regulator